MLDLSVVIVSWNTRDLLDRCLHHAYAAGEGLNIEVIVIDNASTDGSPEMVRQRFPSVRLVENSSNTGFSRANNQGMALCRGRYILLLNSDAFAEPGAFAALIAAMDAHPHAGAAGSRLLNEDRTLQRSAYGDATLATELWQALFLDRLFPASRLFGAYRMTWWAMDNLQEVDWVMGASLILRADTLRQVGSFDERYFMYSEEMDLCYRIRQAGWKIFYVPQSVVVHLWGGSSRQVPRKTFLRLYRSRVMFFRKHYGRLTAGLYKLLLAGSALVRAAGGAIVALITRRSGVKSTAASYAALLMEVWTY